MGERKISTRGAKLRYVHTEHGSDCVKRGAVAASSARARYGIKRPDLGRPCWQARPENMPCSSRFSAIFCPMVAGAVDSVAVLILPGLYRWKVGAVKFSADCAAGR